MKLSWGDNPEINVRVILAPSSNVPVLSQSLVGEHKVAVVLCERAAIIVGHDGIEGQGVGSASTFAYTRSLADHYTKESFEVSPPQDDHDILIPWWWTLQHSIRYLYSGAQLDIAFDSSKCVNCTKSAT